MARFGQASASGLAQLRATAQASGGVQLQISGTRHTESVPANLPDVDKLTAFFRRAVVVGVVGTQAMGMG